MFEEDGMETYLNVPELAALLRLSGQTIRRYVLQKEIPYHKIKKVIRFRPSEIERWVDNGGAVTAFEPDEGRDGKLFDTAGQEAAAGHVGGGQS
jgi:excisionase family DNA binding protein